MLLSPPERLFCAHFNFASLSVFPRHPIPIEGAISDCRRVDEEQPVDGPDGLSDPFYSLFWPPPESDPMTMMNPLQRGACVGHPQDTLA